LARLRELVRAYEVCWEVRPECVAGEEHPKPVGYIVDISATHGETKRAPVAGCPACKAPLEALEDIVAYVLPREHRDSTYDVHIMRGSMQFDRRRGNRPEVAATILIEHGEDFDRPIDACEKRCLDDIVSRLKQLGVREGQWGPGSSH
jgi:hypothetical protein